MPGFWKRPTTRMYSYNLDLGEHYYHPMTSYLDSERGTRGETPGAMTYSERLARNWLHGRTYESDLLTSSSSSSAAAASRAARAASVGPVLSASSFLNSELEDRAFRAKSEARSVLDSTEDTSQVSAWANRQNLLGRHYGRSASSAAAAASSKLASSSLRQEQQQLSSSRQEATTSTTSTTARRSHSVVRDDICKRVADVHMMPWSAGLELDEANSAASRARARIADLERELDEITRRAMTSTSHAVQTAAQMAKQATMEDEQAMASSYKKSKKVMIESSSKMGGRGN